MKNDYLIQGNTTIIYVDSLKYGRKEVLIDTEDLEKVSNYSWKINRDIKNQNLYCVAIYKIKYIAIHRLIMNNPKGLMVDHINNNGLDNCKCNLRICNNAENQQNQKGLRKDNTSGIPCVTWNKTANKWIARIRINGKRKYIGRFSNLNDAAEAIKKARQIYHPFSKESLMAG